MGNMRKRITVLEGKSTPWSMRWRRVIVDGQCAADALAAHETLHGVIGIDGVIYRIIVDPIRAGGSMQ
ncbi:hypothetical protein VVT58_01930 [Sphingobium sp. SJ10-10]|uniref:hypothetical protein n=1 Tax=Sphingobium sp. SJ10-10 TaxID=3114999 RepID=UPI002E1778F1|nr:hypothetical protein [Sphingobium sp. SJ10-10]